MLSNAELAEVERVECLRLLAGQRVGRVVFSDAALPAAFPVSYVLDDEEVVFRTGRGGRLAVVLPGKVVAFEVDEIDLGTRTGWSVLGVGEAYEARNPERLAELAERELEPWAPQRRDVVVCVPLQLLSGRRIVRSSAAPDGLLAGTSRRPGAAPTAAIAPASRTDRESEVLPGQCLLALPDDDRSPER